MLLDVACKVLCPRHKRSGVAGLLSRETQDHSRLEKLPLEVLSRSLSFRSADRKLLPGFSLPDGIPCSSPIRAERSRSRLSSALRFSQPFSGFLAGTSLEPYFRLKPFGLRPPTEVSPRKNRVFFFRSASSLAVIRAFKVRETQSTFHDRFQRRTSLNSIAAIPRIAIGFLSTFRKTFPGYPERFVSWITKQNALHLLRSVSPLTNPFA
jgi:hypothetical protein